MATIAAVKPSRHRTRRAIAATLVVISGILGPVAVTGLWARALVNNTNTYVDAVAPLATDPAITAALEDRVTDAVMNAVDNLDVDTQVQAFLSQRGVPAPISALVSTALAGLNSNLRDLVSRTVTAVIEDPRFAAAWTAVNRTAHEALVNVVDGDSRLLDPQGNLALQLQPVVDTIKQRLIDNGHSWASLLPSNLTAEWVLVPASQVNSLRDTVNALRTVAIVLVIVELLVILGAILLTTDRLRGLAWTAFGLAAGSVAVLGGLRYAEHALIGNATQIQHPDAASALVGTVTASLVNWLRLLFIVGIAVAGIAALMGRGKRARRARAGLLNLRTKLAYPPYSGPRRIAAGVVAVVCALTLVFVDGLSPFAVGALLLLLLIGAVLALIPGAELPEAAASGSADPGIGEPALVGARVGPGAVTPLTTPLPTAPPGPVGSPTPPSGASHR